MKNGGIPTYNIEHLTENRLTSSDNHVRMCRLKVSLIILFTLLLSASLETHVKTFDRVGQRSNRDEVHAGFTVGTESVNGDAA